MTYYKMAVMRGEKGATIVKTELIGQDENGGNIYQQTFDDGSTAQFTAPKGAAGVSFEIGEVITGEAGTPAKVENKGTESNVILDITLPQGEKGEKGERGEKGEQGEKGEKGDGCVHTIREYAGDFKDLGLGFYYMEDIASDNLPSFVTKGDGVFVWVQYDEPRNRRITLKFQNKEAYMTCDYSTQTWTDWEESDLKSSGSGIKTITEQHTIPAGAWETLANSQPFFYQTTITLTTPLTETSRLAILRDDPVFFANFGICIGGDNGQNITLYATSVPPANATITMVIGG